MPKIRLPGFIKRLATGRKSARRVARPVRNEPEYYTGKTRAVLEQARKEAVLAQHSQIEAIHILLALVADNTSPVSQLLAAHGLTLGYFQAAIVPGEAAAQATLPEPGACYCQILEHAAGAALRLKHPYIGSEHLLLGMLELAGENETCKDLKLLKTRWGEIKQELLRLLQTPQNQPFAYH